MAKQNFCVARVETRTRASVGKFERHIERKNESYENMNVDLSRTPMNVHFKGCGELTYNELKHKKTKMLHTCILGGHIQALKTSVQLLLQRTS